MEYRRLGKTGLKVSVLGYGVMTFTRQNDLESAKQLLTCLADAGVNLIDNAEAYGCGGGSAERLFGQAFKELGWKRADWVVTTKIFFGTGGGEGKLNSRGLSRKHIIEGTKASLERMQLDYVDCLFCHRCDPEVEMEEIVRAMNYCVDQGLCFYWGTSEWSAAELMQAHGIAERLGMVGPQYEQCQYNLLERQKMEKDYLPLFEQYGMGTTIWSPLRSGLLSGKYLDGGKDESGRFQSDVWKDFQGMLGPMLADKRMEAVKRLKPVAERLGGTLAQLAIAWCAANPRVSCVLLGASRVDQLEDTLKSLDLLPKLTPEVMAEIDGIIGTKP